MLNEINDLVKSLVTTNIYKYFEAHLVKDTVG